MRGRQLPRNGPPQLSMLTLDAMVCLAAKSPARGNFAGKWFHGERCSKARTKGWGITAGVGGTLDNNDNQWYFGAASGVAATRWLLAFATRAPPGTVDRVPCHTCGSNNGHAVVVSWKTLTP